jgi:iron(II)-dependent oxidoreductase
MATPDVQSALLAREGGADWLSLALMDARNRTLAWLAVFEGTAALSQALQLAAPGQADIASARAHLAATMEAALEQLDGDDDEALAPYRAALHHEDRLVIELTELAQAQGVAAATALLPPQQLLARRPPLWFPAQEMVAASPRGWRPANEAGDDHDDAVPEFEIDAEAVSWQQYVEFMADGGYDDPQWWSDAGWAWVQATQRRAPRDVEQWRHGVLLQSFGRPVRASLAAPVMGVSRHEAEAWCRWAGRRLPAGVEWQVAAAQGASRGFIAHQVSEWVLGRALQRGVPWFAPRRLAHPALRSAVAAERDDGFYGCRSCAL